MSDSVAKISKATYLQSYLSMVKRAGTEDALELMNHILNKDGKDTTKANNLNTIIALAKSGDINSDVTELKSKRDELQKSIRKNSEDDNMGKYREKMERVHIEDIDQLLSRLTVRRNDSSDSLEDYVLLSLMWPAPLRNDLQEISLCTNYRNRGKENCIYLPKNQQKQAELRINEHKTTSRGGKPIVKILNPEQTEAIRKLFSDGRQYLFSNSQGQAMSSASFSNKLSKLFKDALGVPLTSTAMRKIYLSGKYRGIRQRMKADSLRMGHSVKTQQSHYIDNKSDIG